MKATLRACMMFNAMLVGVHMARYVALGINSAFFFLAMHVAFVVLCLAALHRRGKE